MMTHDEISRFFSEEDVKKAFHLPDWPAGTEIVCYCRSTDSRDAIEQITQQRQWKIVEYVHIDELPIAKLYKPGQVMFAKREAVEWKPNLRTKEGKEFRAAFNAKAAEWEVTEDALHEFGIHMTDFERGVSHYIRPMYDPERKRYFLHCGDSVPQAFDKAKLAKGQFDIEYE